MRTPTVASRENFLEREGAEGRIDKLTAFEKSDNIMGLRSYDRVGGIEVLVLRSRDSDTRQGDEV